MCRLLVVLFALAVVLVGCRTTAETEIAQPASEPSTWNFTGELPPNLSVNYTAAVVIDRSTGEPGAIWRHPQREIAQPLSDAVRNQDALFALDGEFQSTARRYERSLVLTRVDLRTGESRTLAELGTEVRFDNPGYSGSSFEVEGPSYRLLGATATEVLISIAEQAPRAAATVVRIDAVTGAELGRFDQPVFGTSSDRDCRDEWYTLRVLDDDQLMTVLDDMPAFLDGETGATDRLVPCDEEPPRLGDYISGSDLAAYLSFVRTDEPAIGAELTEWALGRTLMPSSVGADYPNWQLADGNLWWIAADTFFGDDGSARATVLVRFNLSERVIDRIWPLAPFEIENDTRVNDRLLWSHDRLFIDWHGDDQRVVIFDPATDEFAVAEPPEMAGRNYRRVWVTEGVDGVIEISTESQDAEVDNRYREWIGTFDPVTLEFSAFTECHYTAGRC